MLKKTSTSKTPAVKKKSAPAPKARKTASKTTSVRQKKVSPIPKGYNSIIVHLIVNQAVEAIEFYKMALGAKEGKRTDSPTGKVLHAELKIGDSKIMLAEECPEMQALGPNPEKASAVSIHFYTKNVDAVVSRAVAGGAILIRPIENMFYGDRCATLQDPFGHRWHIATHIEDVTPSHMKKRIAKLFATQ